VWVMPVVGALVDPRLTFVAAVMAYLASGPVLWLKTKRV
jgi:CDP-diacylglycerol--serine O-phosphatidyltransferase